MREQGLAARAKKRRKSTTRQGKGRWRAPDLIGRDFPASTVNRKWYGDGTEIVTDEGKLYLDSVLDMGSRRIVGFALGEHHDAELAEHALVMAVAVRGGKQAITNVIMHTDQGSEGAFNGRRNTLITEVRRMGRPRKQIPKAPAKARRQWAADRAMRAPMRSPGRPEPSRAVRREFLAPDRIRHHNGSGRRRGRRVGAGRDSMVSTRWRPRRARPWTTDWPVLCLSPSVRRSRCSKPSTRACARSPARSAATRDRLARTAPKRCDQGQQTGLPRRSGAVEGTAGSEASEESETGGQRAAA